MFWRRGPCRVIRINMSSLASYAAAEARSTSLDTKSWQHVSLLVDLLLASGDVETAEELALVHIENRLTGRHAPVPLTEMRALASRFPMSVAITQRFVDFAERNRQPLVAQHGRDWIEKLRAGDWSRLIGSARGKRCFIVGSGPSLNLLPLERMRGTDVICVNRGHEAVSRGFSSSPISGGLGSPRLWSAQDFDRYRADGASFPAWRVRLELAGIAASQRCTVRNVFPPLLPWLQIVRPMGVPSRRNGCRDRRAGGGGPGV